MSTKKRKGSRAFLTSLRFVNSLIFDQNRSTLALICPYHPIGLSILSHVEDAYKYHAYIHIDIHTARKTGVMNGIGIEIISGLQLVRHLCHARFLHEGRQGQARSPVWSGRGREQFSRESLARPILDRIFQRATTLFLARLFRRPGFAATETVFKRGQHAGNACT